ncbi:MAG: prephenate dehydrogenase/arogenate dehydrogenase family protein [Clostridia bacterium]|nr:prephenate dehydrogenase/arogenate dehydrogenase family protein [Clostridia bacterium]
MTVGIVGLGLIGGSFARAFSEMTEHTVLACDIDESAFLAAKMVGAVDGVLDDDTLGECDLTLISLYPEAAVNWITEHEKLFKKGSIAVDCCGVKKFVCDGVGGNSGRDFSFIGGHPMAGTQQWGFAHSRASLFKGGSMILTPDPATDIRVLERAKAFFLEVGFSDVVFTTPEDHDARIAFTSQLPHVISNAYVKSPRAVEHSGFSAGSYRDLSRVSKLNVKMWTELFLENADNLADEIDLLADNLKQYSEAIRKGDGEALAALLEDGRESKINAK